MGKIGLFGFIVALCLALFVTGANAEEQMVSAMGRAFGANEIMGVHVKNPQGDVLGRISDLVVDSEGRIALAVLSHGGFLRIYEKETAIPFRALKYDPIAKHLILDISKEKLAVAPAFKMSDLSAQGGAEDFYRYFGQQPYWSEEGELFKGIDEPLEGVPAGSAPFPYVSP
jgi:sporulation protein YlmC with PRC-barrel domain